MCRKHGEGVYVLDTSSFICHPGPLEGFTVSEVLEEAKSLSARMRSSLEHVKILTPSSASVEEVSKLAGRMGEKLSKTDLKILALALDLEREGKNPVILTDDYSIQNLAGMLGMKFSSLNTPGIKRILRWRLVCPSCGKSYPSSERECRICGSPLVRKPGIYRPKRV
ncbi:MAG: hypothetical protein QXH26_04045 [Candidatus Hadarchaeales archaeon]